MVVYNNNNRQNIIDKRKWLPSCSECFNVFVRHLGTFVNASHNWYTVSMVADLCRVVLSCFRCEKAKRRHAKTRPMVTFSCFPMATFRPVTRKYDTFLASPFRLLFVVSLPGGAKGRHAKTRQMVTFSCFRMRSFAPPHESTRHSMRCVFGYCLSYLCLERRKVAMRKPDKITFSRGDLSRFCPENTFIRHGINQPPYSPLPRSW